MAGNYSQTIVRLKSIVSMQRLLGSRGPSASPVILYTILFDILRLGL